MPTVRSQFTPHMSVLTYKSSGSTVGYSSTRDKNWIDMTYQDVEHYGFKCTINNLNSNAGLTGAPIIRMQFRHILSLRTQL